MAQHRISLALKLADDLVADGKLHFTFGEAMNRLGRSPSATANLLRRMITTGQVDRIRRGHYVLRRLGVLGTRASAEDLAMVVSAAFSGHPHRMAYRTALDEHDLIVHPVRTIYVATTKRMRVESLSGRPLCTVAEKPAAIQVGAQKHGPSWISSLERALLDAAARPDLAGGAGVLAEAIVSAGDQADPELLMHHATQLGWAAALRRIGSISDALEVDGLVGKLRPLRPPRADLDLEPGTSHPYAWRDSRWYVRWAHSREELANEALQ